MNNNQKDFIKEKFLQAINSLFKSNDPQLRKEANSFLCLFSQTPESFEISLDILNTPNLMDEAYFNASQILKKKLTFDFGNYFENPQIIISLLKFLIEQIDKFQKAKQYIRINLCQCFSRAMLFTSDNFTQFMHYCVSKLNSQNLFENNLSLIMIFDFLAETYLDSEIVVDDESKDVFVKHLESIEQDVMGYLTLQVRTLNTKLNEGDNVYIQNKSLISNYILETLINWLNIKLMDDTIKKFETEYIDLLNFVFVNDDLIDKHAECVCLLLQFPLDNDEFQTLSQIIFSKVMQYKDLIYKKEHFDPQETGYFIEIFTVLATYNIEQIFTEGRFDIFQLLVDLSKYCPLKCINALCDFWIVLFNHLVVIKISKESALNKFKDMYIQFIMNTLSLVQFPDDLFIELNKQRTKYFKKDDEYSAIKNFRESIEGILGNFANEYGFNFVYDNVIYPQFNSVVSEIKQSPTNTSLWSRFETLLFAFESICSEIPIDNDMSAYEPFFEIVFEVPKELIQIIRTFTHVMDNLKYHLKNNSRLLFKSFELLIKCIDNNNITEYCANSASSLILSNKELFYKNKTDLMKLYHSTFENKILHNENYRVFVEAIIELFCNSNSENSNNEEIKLNISEIFNTWLNYLNEVNTKIETQPKDVPFAEKDKLIIIQFLSVIKIIVRSIVSGLSEANNYIMVELFQTIWPKLSNIVKYFSTNIEIVEQTMQITKHFMRKMKKEFTPYLQEYNQLIIEGYKSTPITSYIYGFEILLTVFSKDENLRTVLENIFSELFNITFTNYLTNPDIPEKYIEIGSDFFGMLGRLMKLNPCLFLDSQLGAKVMEVSLKLITTTQIEVAKNIIGFLNNVITYHKLAVYNDSPAEKKDKIKTQVVNLLRMFSDEIIKQTLNVFYSAHLGVITEELEVLVNNFIVYFKELSFVSFQKHLGVLPADCLTNKEKELFLKTINEYNETVMWGLLDKLIKRCENKQIRNERF